MQEIEVGTNKEMGLRLKEIRSIMNEGAKLSGEQFAYLLEETGDRIRNYELGRAGIPARLFYNLYLRGFNPNYIITGEGDLYAPTKKGEEVRDSIESRISRNNIVKLVRDNTDQITKAVAGKKDD